MPDLTDRLLDFLSQLPQQPQQAGIQDPLYQIPGQRPEFAPLTSSLRSILLETSPPREPEPGLIQQAGRSFMAGIGDLQRTAGSVTQWLGQEELGRSWQQRGQQMAERYQVEHPELSWSTWPQWLATTGVRSLPMTLSLIPAALVGAYAGGGGAAALGLGAFGRTVLQAVGASALSRPLEASLEAGGVYEEALRRGMTPDEADKAADQAFRRNLALAGMDAAEFLTAFAPVPQPVRRVLGQVGSTPLGRAAIGVGRVVGSSAPEAAEEYIQESIQRTALGEPMQWDQQSMEAAALGGLMGAGMGGVGTIYRVLRDRTIARLTDEAESRYQQAYLAALNVGLSPEQAEVMALDAVAGTEDGANAVTVAAKEVAAELEQQEGTPETERPAEPAPGKPPTPTPAPPAQPPTQPQPQQRIYAPGTRVIVDYPSMDLVGAVPPPRLRGTVIDDPGGADDLISVQLDEYRTPEGKKESSRVMVARRYVLPTEDEPGPAQPPARIPTQPPAQPVAQAPALPPAQPGQPEPPPASQRPQAPQPTRPVESATAEEPQQPPRAKWVPANAHVKVGDTVYLPSGEPVVVVDAGITFTVRNAKGAEFQIGRRAVRMEPPQAQAQEQAGPGEESPQQPAQAPPVPQVPEAQAPPVPQVPEAQAPPASQVPEAQAPPVPQEVAPTQEIPTEVEVFSSENLRPGEWVEVRLPRGKETRALIGAITRIDQNSVQVTVRGREKPLQVPYSQIVRRVSQDEVDASQAVEGGAEPAARPPAQPAEPSVAPQEADRWLQEIRRKGTAHDPKRRLSVKVISWRDGYGVEILQNGNRMLPEDPEPLTLEQAQDRAAAIMRGEDPDGRIARATQSTASGFQEPPEPTSAVPAPAQPAPAQPAPRPALTQTEGVRVQVTENEERNGVEVRFTSRPDQKYIDRLKAAKFRWSRKQKLWYAGRSEKTLSVAREIERELNAPGAEGPETPAQEVSTGARSGARSEVPAREVGADRSGSLEGAQAEDVPEAEEAGAPSEGGVRSSREDDGRAGGAGGAGSRSDSGRGDGEGAIRTSPERGGRAEPESEARPVEEPQRRISRNLVIGPELASNLEPRGLKTKYQRNVAAIRLLKELEAEGRPATPEEQAVLALYSGWGSLSEPVFGYWSKPEWRAEREEIKELLTAEELEDARASTLNAHYSSPLEIQTMWQAVIRMGFKGGRVLEPSAGVGHFLGMMPKEIRGHTKVTAIELDSITGRILKQLYPEADVRIQGFQEADMPDGFYDLAISNVPFGNYGVHDRRYAGTGMTKRIHNYFFAKALDKVRPGGVVMFITSRGTMDSTDSVHRKYIADRADLLLAVRLPNTAQEGSGTSVTTDILVLRRRAPDQAPAGESWLDLTPVTVETGELGAGAPRTVRINEYFARHPELVLGKHALIRGMYTADEYSVEADGRVLSQALEAAFSRLPEDVLTPPKSHAVAVAPAQIVPPSDAKYGAFYIENGKVMQRHPKTGEPQEIRRPAGDKTRKIERVRRFIDLREAANTYMRFQLEDASDQAIRGARERLNAVYDAFVKEFGPFHVKENVKELGADPDYLVLSAMEEWDPKTKTAKKGEAFRQRTIQPIRAVEHVDSAKDALMVTLNETGGVDLDHMMRLTGMSREEIIEELHGVIYEDPEDGWLLAEEYLSGNVREKLRIAQGAAAADERFKPNVEALEKVQPEDILAEDIAVSPASAWLPPEAIEGFFAHIYAVPRNRFIAAYNTILGRWVVERKQSLDRRVTHNADIRWGTNRRTAWQLLQDAVADRRPMVFDTREDEDGNEIKVLNAKETALARQKVDEIKQEFVSWLWANEQRKEYLVRLYNDTMNNLRAWEPDGSHLTSFPGANPTAVAKLHDYQKNAIWRQIRRPRTLLAHVVGAGKTWEMVFAAMEMKRVGLIRKPVFVVMNHMAEQFANDIRFLYPNAKVLVTTPQDVQERNLAYFIAKAALGNWDAIVIRHASFTRIPVSSEVEQAVIREELDEIERVAEAFREVNKDEEGTREFWGRRRGSKSLEGRRFIKELERRKKNLEKRLQELQDRAQRLKEAPYWEQIGADALFVDEYQEFRRLFYVTSKSNRGIKGLQDPKGSGRAFDLYMKIRSLEMQHGKRAPVVFATGTPVTNSMVELYTLMRYLDRDSLKASGLEGFDAWASVFAQTASSYEVTVAGQYKKVDRLAKYINWPELVGRWRQFADVKTIDDLEGIINRPKLVGGEVQSSIAPPSEALKRFMEDLLLEAEMPSKDPAKMLRITNKGRLAAVDLRLVDSKAPDDPNSKLNRLVKNVYSIWEKTNDKRSTQVIFADLGTPKGSSKTDEAGASDTDEYAATDSETQEETQTRLIVYDDIKKKLVERGVPPEEIAFIHDYPTQEKKQELFDLFNAGKIRILIASTRKAGVGTNMQRKLYALHNLDCPWYPADLEQRLGRILRPGNENPEVEVWNYATQYTFDEFLWQLIEAKGRMIYALLSGKIDTRVVEDVAGELILNAIQMRAAVTGNPAAKELGEAMLRLNELQNLRSAYQRRRSELEVSLRTTQQTIEHLEKRLKGIERDLQVRQSTQGDDFKMTLGDKVYTKRDEAQAVLTILIGQARSKRLEGQPLGEIGGLTIVYSYEADKAAQDPQGHVSLKGPGGIEYGAIGTVNSLEATLRSLDKKQEQTTGRLEAARKDLAAYQQQLAQKFPHNAEIAELEERIVELNKELGNEKQQDQEEDVVEAGEYEDDDELLGLPEPEEPERPEYVIAKPPPQTDFKPHALHPSSRMAILKEIEKKLAVPIRQGRVRLKGAAGQYDVRQQVIRAKNIYNLRYTLHETGHHLAQVLGLKPNKYADLTDLGSQLYPDKSVKKQREEGLAEFFVLWLRDEDQAYTVAPVFYTDFMKALDANPQVAEALREIQRMYREHLGASAAERIMGHIVHEVPKGRPFLISRDRLYTHLADDLYPIFKAMQVLVGPDEVRSEWDVEIAKNPYVLARMARGRFRRAYVLLTRANMTPDGKEIGPSFEAILRPVRENLLEFEGYLVARRMRELLGRGIEIGHTSEEVEAAIQELETEEFKTAAEQLYAYQDNLLDYLIDAGILTQTDKDAMKEWNELYVPFYRFMGDYAEAGLGARSANRYVDLPDPIKRIRGSDRPILSPLLSIMRNTIYFIDLAERNKAARALADLADQAEGAGWLIEKLPTVVEPQKVRLERLRDDLLDAGIPEEMLDEADLDRVAVIFNPIEHVRLKEKRENIVTVWRDGKAVFYKLHPDLYKALQGLGNPAVGVAGKILSLPTELKRAGSVLSPQFGLRNPLRDMLTAMIFSRYGFRPLVDTLRGLAHVFKKDEVYRQWEHSGGAQSTLVHLSQEYLERDLKKLLGEKTRAEKNLEIVRSPLTFLQMMSQALEEATRVAEFERALEKGATRKEAGYAAREVTLDFQRAGITGKQYNRVKAFFNAAVQGADKLAREFRHRPADMTVKSVLYIMLPSLFLWFKNHDDPRYEELPRWQKDLNWVILTDDRIILIPKPFELGILFGTMAERFLDYLVEGDPKAFDELYDTFTTSVLPGDPKDIHDWLPDAFLPWAEVIAGPGGWSSFLQRPIVPTSEQSLLPEDQYGPRTSETAKLIGKATGTSPRKVEHLIRGYGSTMAMHVLDFLDLLMGEATSKKTTAELIPGAQAFTTRPYQSSKSVDEFYDLLEQWETWYRSLRENYRRQGVNPDAVVSTPAQLSYLRKVRDQMAEYRRMNRVVQESEQYTAEQKRHYTDTVNHLLTDLARRTIGRSPLPPPTRR